MARPEDGEGMQIGELLKGARTRQGIDIRTVEERTKIRTKYLRALEAEDWDVLPSPAYAMGFLRTYAQLLGLDADAIIDEFRRQAETGLEPGHSYGLGEPVLEGRRRPGDRRPGGPGVGVGVGILIVAGIVVAAAVLLVIGLIGNDDENGGGDGRPQAGAKQHQQQRQRRERRRKDEKAAQQQPSQSVVLRLSVQSEVGVCLLSGSDEVLIDGQVLSAGSEEQFERHSFQLRFPTGYDRGQFELALNGKRTRLPELSGPAAFEIEAGSRPRRLDPPRLECP